MVFSNTDRITKYPPDLSRVCVWSSAVLEFVYNILTQVSAVAVELKYLSDRVEAIGQQTNLIGDNRLLRQRVERFRKLYNLSDKLRPLSRFCTVQETTTFQCP